MSDLPTTIGVLRAAFPRHEFPPASVQVYAQALADLGPQAVESAVKALIGRVDWLPSIATIRREVARRELGMPNATEAWEVANSPILYPNAHPCVKAAVQAIGGTWSLRQGRTADVHRDFRRAYEDICESSIRDIAEKGRNGQMIGSQPRGEIEA
jgi:hypothetical protein